MLLVLYPTTSPAFIAQACVLTIMFPTSFESTVLIHYKAPALFGGVALLNALACRVFRLLRFDVASLTPESIVGLSSIESH